MTYTIGLLTILTFALTLVALAFLFWAVATRQFSVDEQDARTIFESGDEGPDDPVA